MPLSAEQKEVLRERMAKAREAKVAKKVKIAKVMEPAPAAPEPEPEPVKQVEKVWSKPRHEPLKGRQDEPLEEPEQAAIAKTPRSKPIKIPTAEPEKEKKTKYAKLVFYQEPGNNKKIKKLTKVLEQSSSEDEQEPVVVPQVVEEPVDPNARYKKLARMSRLFFD
jgi:hypothetical protein